jgi:hypothetical protein
LGFRIRVRSRSSPRAFSSRKISLTTRSLEPEHVSNAEW